MNTLLEEDVRPGMRLGRHIEHDPRSKRFAVQPVQLGTLASVRHKRLVPTYDQGDLGSCTGNSLAGVLSTSLFGHRFHEYSAVRFYARATHLDGLNEEPYKPNDRGSTGLGVAKVAKEKGYIESYQHAFTHEAALTALSQRAVLMGLTWRTGCDEPDGEGRIRFAGYARGGHEVVLDELDVPNQRVWIQNSWGDWGLGGRAWFSWDDFAAAQDDDGDITVLIPKGQS